MHRVYKLLVIALLISGCGHTGGAVAPVGEAPGDDFQRLQGTWQTRAMTLEGQELPEEVVSQILVTFKDHSMIFTGLDGVPRSGIKSFVLDPQASPARIDITQEEGAMSRAIYRLGPDGLTICMLETSDPIYPDSFEATAGSGRMMVSLVRFDGELPAGPAGFEPGSQPGWKKGSFTRVSLEVPEDWELSANPGAPAGTDQLRMFSSDNLRTVFLQVTKPREDLDLKRDTVRGGQMFVARLAAVPNFRDCLIEGSGGSEAFWGRTGVLLDYTFIREGKTEGEARRTVATAHVYGEYLAETNELLFISTVVEGEEKGEIEGIVKSIQLLPLK